MGERERGSFFNFHSLYHKSREGMERTNHVVSMYAIGERT